MLFQLRTDNHIENSQALRDEIQAAVEASLVPRFGDQLRRVEVYLQDENSHKAGARDKRCAIEAHVAGYSPVVVDDKADAIGKAVDGAIEKMLRALDNALGRLSDRGDTVSMSGEET